MQRIKTIFGTLLALGVIRFGRRTHYVVDPAALVTLPAVDATAARVAENTFMIRWLRAAESVTVFVGTQPDSIDYAAPIAHVEGALETTVTLDSPIARPFFGLRFSDHEQPIIVAERALPIAGSVNFRDIGGYHSDLGGVVRWGAVYRAGELHNLTDADVTYIHDTLHVALICDLRGNNEIKASPDRRLSETIATLHLPISDGGRGRELIVLLGLGRDHEVSALFANYYLRIIDDEAKTYVAWLRRLIQPGALPAVLHCTAGKDRTGIGTALLLGVLGVPDETIIADYTLSNLSYEKLSAGLAANQTVRRIGLDVNMLAPLLIADRAWIVGVLAHIRVKYQSIAHYLIEQGGLDSAIIDQLRDALLVR